MAIFWVVGVWVCDVVGWSWCVVGVWFGGVCASWVVVAGVFVAAAMDDVVSVVVVLGEVLVVAVVVARVGDLVSIGWVE
jgi:hypothetical protein